MSKYHYYTSESNVDLIYEMPIYFDVGIEMSTTTFNNMFGRPTLGRLSTVTLERVDEEDLRNMKKFASFKEGLIRIPYPNILSDMIENDQYKIKDDDSLAVS